MNLLNKINIYKNLMWKKNIFDYTHAKSKILIGRELLVTSRILGHRRLLEGICITIRSKRFFKLTTSLVLRRKTFGVVFFVDFPLFLIGTGFFEVRKLSYSRKISCSRLSYSRFLM